MHTLLARLKAVADPTRLRLLALCAAGDLTVSDLVAIVGQSQPRVSKHLRVLVEADLLTRTPEGNFAVYRAAHGGDAGRFVRQQLALLPAGDATLAQDRQRLARVQTDRARAARTFLDEIAPQWDHIRSLHVPAADIERALLAALPDPGDGIERLESLLDIGTGTGRVMQVLAPRFRQCIGIDQSRAMLTVARTRLESADGTGSAGCAVRLADMDHLPFPDRSFQVATLHMVLHYAADPAATLAEAARVLAPGGRLLVADFAPHDEESLRTEAHHLWLGFDPDDLAGWLVAAGLRPLPPAVLPGAPLTVLVTAADRGPA